MKRDRLAMIEEHLEVLKARRAQLVARASTEARRNRARQAIILGTWLLARRPDVVEQIKSELQRPQDRIAFGLPVIPRDGSTEVDVHA